MWRWRYGGVEIYFGRDRDRDRDVLPLLEAR